MTQRETEYRNSPEPSDEQSARAFRAAAEEPVPGFCREFLSFLRHNPSWWLTPLIITLVLLGLAVTLIPVEAMPFIYSLW